MFFFSEKRKQVLPGRKKTSVPVVNPLTPVQNNSSFQIKHPPQSWFDTVKNTVSFTPDWRSLSEREFLVMFFYNELMCNNTEYERFLKNYSVFLSNGFSVEPFTMFKKKLGKFSFPIALRKRFTTEPYLPVKGEIFFVETNHIPKIDQYMMNGTQFRRELITIRVPITQKVRFKDKSLAEKALGIPLESSYVIFKREKFIKAWTYVGKPSLWLSLIEGGYELGSVRFYSEKSILDRKYFYFSSKLETEEDDNNAHK